MQRRFDDNGLVSLRRNQKRNMKQDLGQHLSPDGALSGALAGGISGGLSGGSFGSVVAGALVGLVAGSIRAAESTRNPRDSAAVGATAGAAAGTIAGLVTKIVQDATAENSRKRKVKSLDAFFNAIAVAAMLEETNDPNRVESGSVFQRRTPRTLSSDVSRNSLEMPLSCGCCFERVTKGIPEVEDFSPKRETKKKWKAKWYWDAVVSGIEDFLNLCKRKLAMN